MPTNPKASIHMDAGLCYLNIKLLVFLVVEFIIIYTEGGNMETSYCTVKHITFTGEAASAEAPAPGATADGLKLYSGSKVTFKALDGYVINSISGDESLSFKGSRQTVEFPGLPEKTITAPIVVLYSKAATETD